MTNAEYARKKNAEIAKGHAQSLHETILYAGWQNASQHGFPSYTVVGLRTLADLVGVKLPARANRPEVIKALGAYYTAAK